MLAEDAVRKVSHDAPNDEAEGKLAEQRVRIEMVPAEKQNDQRNNRNERKQTILAGERTPRGTSVLPINEPTI